MGNSKQQSNKHKKRRQSDQTRLESWKAIANFLNRSVRTVRRWEADEHLPVYRHRHKKGASVYAYCSELDAWRDGHQKIATAASTVRPEYRERRLFPIFGRNAAIPLIIVFAGGIVAGTILVKQVIPGVGILPSVQSPQISDRAGKPDEIVSPELAPVDVTYWSESIARAAVLPVLLAWVDGRMQDALDENQKVLKQLARYPMEAQPHLIEYLADLSLAMGRAEDAKNIIAVIHDNSRREELQAKLMFAMGNKEVVRTHLQRGTSFVNETTPLFMAMTGLVEEAIELNSELGSAETRTGRLNVILSIAAMVGDDKIEAESRLRAAMTQLDVSDQGYYLVAVDMLSDLLMSKGHQVDAIRLLERTTSQRDVAASNKSGIFWLMCQNQLLTLYRKAGRESDALRLEGLLRQILILADEDFPLMQSLSDV